MALLVSEFRERFPPFADAQRFSDAYISIKLDEAVELMDLDYFGDRFDSAQGYLTAHLLESMAVAAGSSGVAGEVSSITAGPASITYSNSAGKTGGSSGAGELNSTAYGRRFLEYLGPGVMVV